MVINNKVHSSPELKFSDKKKTARNRKKKQTKKSDNAIFNTNSLQLISYGCNGY